MSKSPVIRKVHGVYPERRRVQENWFVRLSTSLLPSYTGKNASADRLGSIIQRVKAQEGELTRLGEDDLTARIHHLRGELRKHGVTSDLACCSLAMAREVSARCLGTRYQDTQIGAAWALLCGMAAEIASNEGRVAAAALAACTAAMAGVPTHVVAATAYLAERNARYLRPVYERMGVSLGSICQDMTIEERQRAYLSDVVYCGCREHLANYLHDQLVMTKRLGRISHTVQRLYGSLGTSGKLNMRGLHFAIVDDADHILIDEARNPLVIAGEGNRYFEQDMYRQAIHFASQLTVGEDFILVREERRVEFTDQGRARLSDISRGIGSYWNVTDLREMFVLQALTALHCFTENTDYQVHDDRIAIVDEGARKIMVERGWNQGLQQMIECVAGCTVSTQKDTLASMTFQRFFRRYHMLAALAGEVREVAGEFDAVYGLPVMAIEAEKGESVVPDPECFVSLAEKGEKMAGQIMKVNKTGRPIVIHALSKETVDWVHALLNQHRLVHALVSGAAAGEDAENVAQAWQAGRITVVMNIAARGISIWPQGEAKAHGGYHVIASEPHGTQRLDRQFFSRFRWSGEPCSYATFVSMEDFLFRPHVDSLVHRLVLFILRHWQVPGLALMRWYMNSVQRKNEKKFSRLRRELLLQDDSMEAFLAFSGERG